MATDPSQGFDITAIRKKYTPLRNGLDRRPRQRVTTLLNTAECAEKEIDPEHKPKVLASYEAQRAKIDAEFFPVQ